MKRKRITADYQREWRKRNPEKVAAYKAQVKERLRTNPEAFQRARETKRRWKPSEETKRYRRQWMLVKRYGLTNADYEELKKKQNGKCAICEREANILVVDHCHETNLVRGLLCNACNWALGHFNDDADHLISAANYIQRYQDAKANQKLGSSAGA